MDVGLKEVVERHLIHHPIIHTCVSPLSSRDICILQFTSLGVIIPHISGISCGSSRHSLRRIDLNILSLGLSHLIDDLIP